MSVFTVATSRDPIHLSAKAELPEGIVSELHYQWYASEWTNIGLDQFEEADYFIVEGATEPMLTVLFNNENPNGNNTPYPLWNRTYRLEASYIAADGTVVVDNDYTYLVCSYTLNHWRQQFSHMSGGGLFVIFASPLLQTYIIGKAGFYMIKLVTLFL